MQRRDFLLSMSAAGAASVLSAPAIWSPARAQSRQEILLVITEYGPNNFDIHGVGTNRPGYEVSWNCYDRLMSHGTKTLADGTLSYDRDKFTPELAEDWNATDTARSNDHFTSFAVIGVPSWNLASFLRRNVIDVSVAFQSSASSGVNLSRS